MKSSILRFSAVALIAAMAFVVSCKDDDPTLSVDPVVTDAEFTANGLTLNSGGSAISATFTVATNQGDWNAESNQQWLQVTNKMQCS
jgi:hypothetical protein